MQGSNLDLNETPPGWRQEGAPCPRPPHSPRPTEMAKHPLAQPLYGTSQLDGSEPLSPPEQILNDRARNFDRLGKPKQPNNDGKVKAGAEGARQQDADDAGIAGQKRHL